MLKDTLRSDFNEARKTGNAIKKFALEAVIAAILHKEKTQVGKTVTDEEIIDCITKEVKVQKEIVEMYIGKDEQKAAESRQKAEILMQYLPKQLTDQQVLELVKELDIYDDNSNKTKGMIIKALMPQINGKFDKSKVNMLVEGYLSSK